MTGTDHTSSSLASHSSTLAPTSLDPSRPWPPSAPDLGATAEAEGSANAALHKEISAALHTFSAIHEHIISTPDFPPQSPSPQLIIDVAMLDLSRSSLDAEHIGDHPPRPSQTQYDIV